MIHTDAPSVPALARKLDPAGRRSQSLSTNSSPFSVNAPSSKKSSAPPGRSSAVSAPGAHRSWLTRSSASLCRWQRVHRGGLRRHDSHALPGGRRQRFQCLRRTATVAPESCNPPQKRACGPYRAGYARKRLSESHRGHLGTHHPRPGTPLHQTSGSKVRVITSPVCR